MKKVVENNSDKSCDNSDLSSSDISGNESDTGLTIVVNEEKPTKNKKKVTTEKFKKLLKKIVFSAVMMKNQQKMKRKFSPRKQNRLLKK